VPVCPATPVEPLLLLVPACPLIVLLSVEFVPDACPVLVVPFGYWLAAFGSASVLVFGVVVLAPLAGVEFVPEVAVAFPCCGYADEVAGVLEILVF